MVRKVYYQYWWNCLFYWFNLDIFTEGKPLKITDVLEPVSSSTECNQTEYSENSWNGEKNVYISSILVKYCDYFDWFSLDKFTEGKPLKITDILLQPVSTECNQTEYSRKQLFRNGFNRAISSRLILQHKVGELVVIKLAKIGVRSPVNGTSWY